MTTYLCNARRAQNPDWLLFYANPHDIRPDPPKPFINLPISLLSLGLSLGLPAPFVAMTARWTFGLMMILLIGWLAHETLSSWRWAWLAGLVLAFGGGHAWLWAAEGIGLSNLSADAIRRESAQYYWWFLSTFPNLMYPLELFYHCVVIGTAIAVGKELWTWAILLGAVAWLSSPFVALQLTPPLLLATAVSGWHFVKRARVGQAALADIKNSSTSRIRRAAIVVLGIIYLAVMIRVLWSYMVTIPSDPVLSDFLSRHRNAYSAPLPLDSLLKAHGLGLGLLILLLANKQVRRLLWSNALYRFVLLFLVWTLFLTQHTRFGLFSAQPMHFARGYIHFCTWLLVFVGVRYIAARHKMATSCFIGAAVVSLTLLPDTLAFAYDQYRRPPHKPSLRWGPDDELIYTALRALPGSKNVVAPHWTMGRLVCAMTPHRSAFGTDQTTPEHDARMAQVAEFVQDPAREPPLIAWADVLLLDRQLEHHVNTTMGNWIASRCSEDRCVWQRDKPRAEPGLNL